MFGHWPSPCLDSVWMSKMRKAGCRESTASKYLLEFTAPEKNISYLSEQSSH